MRPPNQDSLSLTRRRKEKNQLAADADKDNEEGITFDPSVTEKEDLLDCFRIFVDPKKVMNIPAV